MRLNGTGKSVPSVERLCMRLARPADQPADRPMVWRYGCRRRGEEEEEEEERNRRMSVLGQPQATRPPAALQISIYVSISRCGRVGCCCTQSVRGAETLGS